LQGTNYGKYQEIILDGQGSDILPDVFWPDVCLENFREWKDYLEELVGQDYQAFAEYQSNKLNTH
jgi:hypothetical protein